MTPLERLRYGLEPAGIAQGDARTALLVGLIARAHVLLEGPPGCGKSLLAQSLVALAGARAEAPVLHRDLRAGDLLGDALLAREFVAGGERLQQRRVPGALLGAELWLLDDLSRAPAAALAPLAHILERRSMLGRPLPLELAIATLVRGAEDGSAFAPDPALLERFALRVRMTGLVASQRFDAARVLLEAGAPGMPAAVLDTPLRHALQRRAAQLPLAPRIARGWLELVRALGARTAGGPGSPVSDRVALRSAPALLRAHALLRGAPRVEAEDLAVARLVFGWRLAGERREELAALIEAVQADVEARRGPAASAGVSGAPGEGAGAASEGSAGSAQAQREAELSAGMAEAGSGAGIRPLLRALEGEWARGAAGRDEDPAGAPRGQRRLRALDEVLDADPVEAWLYASGAWADAPRVWRRQRRGAGAVALLRDVSASMEGRLGAWAGEVIEALVQSARRFALPVGYLEFDHEAVCFRERGAFLHRHYAGLLALARRRRAAGRTSYEAPLRAALAALRRTPGRERHVVLLTDGRPVAGDPEVRAERALARRLGIRVHTVFIGLGACPAVLDRLSAETGGLGFLARPGSGGKIRIEPRAFA